MDINLAYAWIMLATLLILFEMTVGTMVLLSFGISALVVSLALFTSPELSVAWQLGIYALANLIIAPLAIRFLRPRFSPKARHYGTAGSGAQDGLTYRIRERDYDKAMAISIDNDLYRAQFTSGEAPGVGETVTLLRFEGSVAIVAPSNTPTNPRKEQ